MKKKKEKKRKGKEKRKIDNNPPGTHTHSTLAGGEREGEKGKFLFCLFEKGEQKMAGKIFDCFWLVFLW
jgi:hypothetical protein